MTLSYTSMHELSKWDLRYIDMAYLISQWSKDPSTKCGAVITDLHNRVISVGFNGFARGVNDSPDLYLNRPEKIRRIIHAEKNAILFAQRDLTGCTLYVVPMPPCSQCAGMIIQSGITKVISITPTENQLLRWGDDFETTKTMFEEVGITFILIGKQKA